jgi:NAD(P)-binding Rossmann-like domain
LKRRDFLRGSLTLAGLGFCGCPQGSPTREESRPRGSRRDPNYQQGHRLWEGSLPEQPSRIESVRGVILGGGIAGLSAGWRWSHAGFADYRLLELEQEFGGNSRALKYPASMAPIGAHYLPLPNVEARAVRRLLEEMDILRFRSGRWQLAEEHLCHSRQERLYFQDAWHEGLIPRDVLSPSALQQLERFQRHIRQWREKRDGHGRKIFALPLQYSSREPQYLSLDQMSFGDYARQEGWDDSFLLWFLEYACRDDFGCGLESCSAWAGLHYFASRDGGGLGGTDDVLVWPEGNNRLARFLRQSQRGDLRAGSLVLSVHANAEGVVVDYLDLATQQRIRLQAQTALFCLPGFMRGRLTGGALKTEAFVYPPWLTANLALDRFPQDQEAPGFVAWDNVIYQSPSLGYVVATHQSLNTDPLRPTVWTWYRPFIDRPAGEVRKDLLTASWSDWAEVVLDELASLHPDIRERCQQLDITILGHGMIRPSVGFIWGPELAQAREPEGALFFGHGDLSGMSVFEESQFRGVLAAEGSLRFLGEKVETFL